MEEILAQARRLGHAIAAHERFKTLREAEQRVSADESASKVQEAFERQVLKIAELERQTKPVEVADKREFARLQDAVRTHPALQELAKAQADYLEMMNNVNDAILNELRTPSQRAAATEPRIQRA